MKFIIFLLIYILASVFFIIIINKLINKKVGNNKLSLSFSVAIGLGITFILGIIFLYFFAGSFFCFVKPLYEEKSCCYL